MFWYYIIGGSAALSLIVSYLWGNKIGHQQEQHSKEAVAASLDAEIAQKKQAENNLTLETERLLRIRDQQFLARQRDYSQKIAVLDESLSKKQKELERLNSIVADAHVSLDLHRQQILDARMRDLDYQERTLAEREKKIKENQDLLDSILHADHSDTPYFAKQYADCLYLIDLKIASELEHKARPAFTAAEKVREMSGQKRVLQEQCKLQEYQLNLYEAAFPWLSEFKEISPEDLASVVNIASTPENEYSTLKKWLSPQEYQTLSEADRLQLALDRYSIGKKATGRSALNMSDMSATVTSKKVIRFATSVQPRALKIWGAT